MNKYVLYIFSFFLMTETALVPLAQGEQEKEPEKEYLLLNKGLQLRITEAVNSLYNFDFETAERGFLVMSYTYPEHPLPYFLMGLSQWWKIAPDTDNQQYDALFLKYMALAI